MKTVTFVEVVMVSYLTTEHCKECDGYGTYWSCFSSTGHFQDCEVCGGIRTRAPYIPERERTPYFTAKLAALNANHGPIVSVIHMGGWREVSGTHMFRDHLTENATVWKLTYANGNHDVITDLRSTDVDGFNSSKIRFSTQSDINKALGLMS